MSKKRRIKKCVMALVLENTEDQRCHLIHMVVGKQSRKLPFQIQNKRQGENTFSSAKDKIVKGKKKQGGSKIVSR